MSIKLAISNIAWEAKHDDPMLRRLSSCGYEGLEIAPTRVFPEQPYDRLSQAKDYARRLWAEHGLPVCSMQSIWYGRTESVFGSQSDMSVLTSYTKQAVRFAEAVGCPNLVLGSPKNRTIPSGRRPEEALGFFREIGDYAARHSAVIALEGVPALYGTNFLNTTEELYQYTKLADSDGIRMNLDLGTMLANNERITGVGKYLELVSHVHISEPYLEPIRKRAMHAVLAKALTDGGYEGYVSIEMKNQGNPAGVLETMEYIRGMLDASLQTESLPLPRTVER